MVLLDSVCLYDDYSLFSVELHLSFVAVHQIITNFQKPLYGNLGKQYGKLRL